MSGSMASSFRTVLSSCVSGLRIRCNIASSRSLTLVGASHTSPFTVNSKFLRSRQSLVTCLARSLATKGAFRNPGADLSQGKRAPKEEEFSDLIVNLMTGEKMPLAEYITLSKQQVLRILVDGAKQEMTLQEAIREARDMDLDPVLVARDSNPLVIKIMDYGKVRHDRTKKLKASVKKTASNSVKELRIGLNIGQHDLDIKLKQAREFLDKGHRVKLFIQLRGADYYNAQQQACDKIDEISNALSSVATRESKASLLGNVASVTMMPMPKKAAPAKQQSPSGKDAEKSVGLNSKPAEKSALPKSASEPKAEKPAAPKSAQPKAGSKIAVSQEEHIVICKVGQVSNAI